MLGVGERARAPAAASSAQRGHRILHAPCLAHPAEHVRGSAGATTSAVTTIVLLEDYGRTRVNAARPLPCTHGLAGVECLAGAA